MASGRHQSGGYHQEGKKENGTPDVSLPRQKVTRSTTASCALAGKAWQKGQTEAIRRRSPPPHVSVWWNFNLVD
ncbi:hypothetical protein ZHAS_00011021 [Anopheles sinensis]|uniref:Uncharacterized protein n=1 Tax=Anopheles sinensis TaxID=74873 RepID=A0A084VZ49_ANOSI|nr:hypothetical protein ZHAS_00011021 [Anopheles sinensis]